MTKTYKSLSRAAGLPPGEPVHVGERLSDVVTISIFDYTGDDYTEKIISSPDECIPFRDTPAATWLNVEGIHDAPLIEKLGNAFGLHPLVIEDILNTSQRPKVEDYGDYLYIVMKAFKLDEATAELETEQVSLVLGPTFVLSFEERKTSLLEPVRERIRKNKGRVRKHGPDYLAYVLMDSIVDSYLVLLEQLEEDMDILEEELVISARHEVVNSLHELKRALILLRKSIWPLRDAVNVIDRSDSKLIHQTTRVYLRDLYDHTNLVIDSIETFRETLSVTLDVYLSSMSNRTNEVMKVLTIIATIFIPLTFLAGVYGMNFKYLPELEWHLGYPIFWIICFTISGVMLYFFRKNNWI